MLKKTVVITILGIKTREKNLTVKIATLQPTKKNYEILVKVMDNALREMLKDIMTPDWHLFKDMKGSEIFIDQRFKNFIRMRKYPATKFRNAITPVKEEDFLKKNVSIDVVLDNETNSIVGFTIWAFNMELQEHNMLVYIYVFVNHRRKKIAKELIEHHKTEVIIADTSEIVRIVLKKYFEKKVVFMIKNELDWKPESDKEREKIEKVLGRPVVELTSTWNNFMEII